MRNKVYLLLLGLFLLTLALVVRSGLLARKEPGRPINSAMRDAMSEESPQMSEDDVAIVRAKYGNARRLHSGLLYVERAPGNGGSTPRNGQEVIVHYAGSLLDGTPIDSSYTRGAPFTFRLGAGEVIQGWDDAVLGMRKGEKRTLIIPYWLGYGLNGRPPKIPPRATLVFDVELLDIR
ncbi:MAG: peptidylprolyl isomerase FKBP-type [Verrucomicrobia bacterium]|nr:peptidylprolyl isomerase FKBP-type [Verrucomicrobiota bacterium]